MDGIKLSVTSPDIICVDTPAPPCAMVVFGASGDLTIRKLLVSLTKLFAQNLLDEHFFLLGCSRTNYSDAEFRNLAQKSLRENAAGLSIGVIKSFIKKLYYVSGDYGDPAFYKSIGSKIAKLSKASKIEGNIVFYLAVPPFLYGIIVEQLRLAGLSCPGESDSIRQVKLVVEKPFGRDLKSATELNSVISKCFDESQIYRIDHYLGKETVQNILIFRFANTIFEPVWNRNHIDSVQITIAETLGIEHRGSYYDKAGALRDIFQNHMLQMLSLVAMEPPISFQADHVRDEKVKLLSSIRPFKTDELDSFTVRGQYGPGVIDGREVVGYREEPEVYPQSMTETFVAAKLFVDNWRWKDVPFYLRTGKRLAKKDTEIAVTFKKVPHSMFSMVGFEDMPSNVLVLQIQPEEGISLGFQAKRPGSKLCMDTLNMSFKYESIFRIQMPEAYERLLLDCMAGDQTLFMRFDSVEASWRLLMPVLDVWENSNLAPYEYPAGSYSFLQADALIEADGRMWRKLAEI
jgi:glucose-6-phosphate 1-dehydrogenase